MTAVRDGSRASRLVWVYLTIVALLTIVGHQVGTELWDREWEAADKIGDPELGSLYRVLGLVGGFTLAIVLVFAHIVARWVKSRYSEDPDR